jgi:DNA-binding response OmpR family regulator
MHLSIPNPLHLVDQKPPLPFLKERPQLDPSETHGRPKRILVIDDETVIADSVVDILSLHGWDAIAFYNGLDAIEFARKNCPDIVISDVVMPKPNGIETVLAIRELCHTARILLFSGQAATTDILRDARAKGHQFELVQKPIHPDQLLKKISSLKNS